MSRLIADLQRVEARNTELAAENELLRGIVGKLHETCGASVTGNAIYSEDDEAGSRKLARDLTPDEAALFDDVTKEAE